MSDKNIFETAAKMKLRFNTGKGNSNVEDLWDLPLTSKVGPSLDTVAQALDKEVKDSAGKSFVVKRNKVNEVAELKFEIVLYIIAEKKAFVKANKKAAVVRSNNAEIREAIVEKKSKNLRKKSVSELERMLEDE